MPLIVRHFHMVDMFVPLSSRIWPMYAILIYVECFQITVLSIYRKALACDILHSHKLFNFVVGQSIWLDNSRLFLLALTVHP